MRINVSQGKMNYSQRNNERNPHNACNVTSIVMALDYLGYDFPPGPYKQPEDNLHYFMEQEKLRPTWHYELSTATNKWMGRRVTDFSTERPIGSIFEELKKGKPVVLSGDFPFVNSKSVRVTLGHIVVLVGAEWDGDGTGNPKSVIIDDPYGNTINNFQGSGNDVVLSWDQFVKWFKTVNSTKTKWGHFFKRPDEC